MDATIADKNDEFFSKYPLRSYPKGQILIFADESPQHIFYLVAGKVRKYDVSYRGDEIIVNIFKPPAFFPMSWALNRLPNKYFYKTEEPTELRVVPVTDALEYLKSNPDVMLDLLSRIYRGMDGMFGRLVRLMSGSAKSRLIYELIIESRRFGKKLAEKHLLLSASESDLAARTGLSRETVSREMQKLKEQKLVQVDHRGIVVKDLTALEHLHGAEL